MKKHPVVEQLAKERKLAGMKIADLAYQVGRCQSLMEKYEYGGRIPNFPVLTAWADVFGYEVVLKKKD